MTQASAAATYRARSWSGLFAPHDLIVLGYLLVIGLLVWRADGSVVRDRVALHIEVTFVAVLVGCVVARGLHVWTARVRAAVYKVTMMAVGIEAYLMLRDLLPLIRPDAVDAPLLAIDLWLFGVEPAVWLQRFNGYLMVEYFSFFYFSYYLIIFSYLITVMWPSKRPSANTELAVGTFMVLLVGHLGYMSVPGYGPVRYLAHDFQQPLDGGFWWSCVWQTVQAGGAMKDIFPSLHTAMPTYLTLYALRQARIDPRWRWPARVTGFFALNIVFSTVFLRWHYAIDLVAGLALAGATAWVAPRLADWDQRFRNARGLPSAWAFDHRPEPP